ncbi:MAG TPA: DUF4404 family protein [Gemmataceae bacterium]|nr:DUF4404 family protein [Gemmataceae bacterium]
MPDQPPAAPPPPTPPPSDLHELARLLRHADHLGPEERRAVANLLEELGRALPSSALPADEKAQLTASAALLARALHEQQDEGVLAHARERLQEAAARAEARAPIAANILGRLFQVLADWGI